VSVVKVNAATLEGAPQSLLRCGAIAFDDDNEYAYNAFPVSDFASRLCCVDTRRSTVLWAKRMPAGCDVSRVSRDRLYALTERGLCIELWAETGVEISRRRRVEDLLTSSISERVAVFRRQAPDGPVMTVLDSVREEVVFQATLPHLAELVGGLLWTNGCLLCPLRRDDGDQAMVYRYDFETGLVWSSGPSIGYYVITAFIWEERVFAIYRQLDTGQVHSAELDAATGKVLRTRSVPSAAITWCPYGLGSGALSVEGVLRVPSMLYYPHNVAELGWL
jgi:hypothetical protein